MLAGKYRRIGVVNAVAANGVVHLEPVPLTHIKIFQTVSRRGVHTAGTGLGGHVLTKDDRYRCLAKRRCH